MPDLVGLPETSADSIITSIGLSIGNISYQFSSEIPEGQIISQIPQAGVDIPLGTPVNLVISKFQVINIALNKASTADSEESLKGNTANKGNDGNLSTRWCANDGNLNHWWQVDLGDFYNIEGTEVNWEYNGVNYKYIIKVSSDNVNWQNTVDKSNNNSISQVQQDYFNADSIRYVRIVITGLETGSWASFWEFNVFISSITDVNEKEDYPKKFSLNQNYPNPFNPTTTINYSLPNMENSEASLVKLKIYDVLGREVETLVDEKQKPGYYHIKFDGSNLSSGIYFCRLQVKQHTETIKMIYQK